jgi:hypothetical protein
MSPSIPSLFPVGLDGLIRRSQVVTTIVPKAFLFLLGNAKYPNVRLSEYPSNGRLKTRVRVSHNILSLCLQLPEIAGTLRLSMMVS